jgi:DNA-binding MarR family transcriptional regulator
MNTPVALSLVSPSLVSVMLKAKRAKGALDALSLEDQIVVSLRRISQAIDVWSRHLWQDYGLTSPQLATLREILAGKNVSPVTLATALHLSQPTVTGILGRLEQRGLIRRQRSSTDRRSVLATVTDQGRELAAKAPPLLRDYFRHELAKLGTRQRSEILTVLQRVATMMQAPEVAEAPFFFHDQEGTPRADKRRPHDRTAHGTAAASKRNRRKSGNQ